MKPASHFTRDEIAARLSYDPETGFLTWKCGTRCFKSISGTLAGSLKKDGYLYIAIDGTTIIAHRIAWILFHGNSPEGQIDHINGHKDDNRISNLREATNSENHQNKWLSRRNTTGYKGVSRTRGKRFAVFIKGREKQIYIGTFDTAVKAAMAYDSAARSLHGSFARVNFPQ